MPAGEAHASSDAGARPVAVIGAGTMGAGIAQVALEAGHPVALFDVDEIAFGRARERIRDGLRRRGVKAGLDLPDAEDRADDQLARLRGAASIQAAANDATLVIEAALEDLELKRRVFATLDAAASPEALLATNTSALSVASIADATTHPDRVLGLHFFNPAPVMALVEVVVAPRTRPAAADAAEALMAEWGKSTVRCADAPGFIVNRVNRPFTLEPLRMLEAGLASIDEIDAAIRAAGYPMGPFAYMDLVGIDINLAATRSLYAGLGRPVRLAPSIVQEELVAAGRLGRKTGHGFYRYSAEGESLGVASAIAGPAPRRAALAGEAIADRVVLAIANEAFFAVGDRVAWPNDIDRALRLGVNHPHGPIEWARARGLGLVLDALESLRAAEGERFSPAPALREAAASVV
jgi:3-hydroxybutyryl-CoA dehydrogenase